MNQSFCAANASFPIPSMFPRVAAADFLNGSSVVGFSLIVYSVA